MPTIKDACRTLDITWQTFTRWCERLQLDAGTTHPLDRRLRIVPDATVEAIRAARDEMRGVVSTKITPSESPVMSTQGHVPLPVGWMSANRWYEVHQIHRFAVLREVERGNIPEPEHGEWWTRGHSRPTLLAYPPEQHRAASAFASRRWPEHFVSCPQCLRLLPEEDTSPDASEP